MTNPKYKLLESDTTTPDGTVLYRIEALRLWAGGRSMRERYVNALSAILDYWTKTSDQRRATAVAALKAAKRIMCISEREVVAAEDYVKRITNEVVS
jgi:hypothetical protein